MFEQPGERRSCYFGYRVKLLRVPGMGSEFHPLPLHSSHTCHWLSAPRDGVWQGWILKQISGSHRASLVVCFGPRTPSVFADISLDTCTQPFSYFFSTCLHFDGSSRLICLPPVLSHRHFLNKILTYLVKSWHLLLGGCGLIQVLWRHSAFGF